MEFLKVTGGKSSYIEIDDEHSKFSYETGEKQVNNANIGDS